MEEWLVKWLKAPPGPPDQFGRGQCAACGLLGRRTAGLANPILEEIHQSERMPGTGLVRLSNGEPATPWCLVAAADLPAEVRAVALFMESRIAEKRAQGLYHGPEPGTPEWAAAPAGMVITKQRELADWFPYYEFLSPAEHREMRQMLRLEEDRKALQTRLADMELRQREHYESLRSQAEGIAERRERVTFGAFLVIGIVGVALGLAAIAATLYPDLMRDLILALTERLSQ